MKVRPFNDKAVESIFQAHPTGIRDKLLEARELIFQIAEQNDEIGKIEETLKWDTPSYLTSAPKSGTTIRLSAIKDSDHRYAISVHCQTTLVAEFKDHYPDLDYDGNRSLILSLNEDTEDGVLEAFIYAALSYHHRKKATRLIS